jgi:8-amino-3,8-dideoxy-alpha-D-manno-octulosonate transaminase
MSTVVEVEKLAIQGGKPAKQRPDPPMYPGGMEIDEQEETAVLEVLRAKRLFRYYGPNPGPSKVAELEKEFATKKGVQFAQAVTSGTAALICSLQGIGVGPGDEVIIPAYTWIATASAVLALGAVPIMAEVDETLLLDPEDFARKITPYTKAVIPVHMRGAPCRMDEILAVARQHGIKVVEDCAQANGATYKGREVGSMGDAGAYSLQFNKIITAGEGGMVTTNDRQVWERVTMFHDVAAAQREKLNVPATFGVNFRMPEVLGAIALVQLHKLDGVLAAMRARKRMLKAGMAEIAQRKGVTFRELADEEGDAAIAHIFFMPTPQKAQEIAAALRAENIGAGVMYAPNVSDYHVYAHWDAVMQKRAWAPGGNPWQWAPNEDVEETIDGINRVLATLG